MILLSYPIFPLPRSLFIHTFFVVCFFSLILVLASLVWGFFGMYWAFFFVQGCDIAMRRAFSFFLFSFFSPCLGFIIFFLFLPLCLGFVTFSML